MLILGSLALAIGLIQTPAQANLPVGKHYPNQQQAGSLTQGVHQPASSRRPYPEQIPEGLGQAGGPKNSPTLIPHGGTSPSIRRNSAPLQQTETYNSLQQKAAQQGTVRVIVGLDARFSPEGRLSPSEAVGQRLNINQAQSRVLQKLPEGAVISLTRFKFIPFMVIEVNQQSLARLSALDEVISIHEDIELLPFQEDIPITPALASTIPVIGVDNVWSDGFTGQGQAIAVLDSGVDLDHLFFAGKTASEACFSTTRTITGSTTITLCPNGMEEQNGSGSGVPCSGLSGCDHGTHVAGIALGNNGSSFGVARDADLIAIQVFSRENVANCGSTPPPCITAFVSDIVQGLERVLELQNDVSFTPDIASVNLSLGGGDFDTSCDGDFPSVKTAVDNLRSAGIVTVAAAGNDGITGGISTPACVSTVVSVGATDDSDNVANFSNCASIMDIWAPGVNVTSSVPGGLFAAKSGTSMSTPHVAGAWALAGSKSPQSNITDILAVFIGQGVSIPSQFGCPVKPRIQVDSALDELPLGPCIPPGSGDWTIASSQVCTLTQSPTISGDLTLGQGSSLTISSGNTITVTGNVTLEENSTLTVEASAVVDVDFNSKHLRVLNGAKAEVAGRIQ